MPRKFKKILKGFDASYFFIPFLAFGLLLIAYLIVNSVFYKQNSIFPKGVRFVADEIIVNYKDGESPEELQLAGKTQESSNLVSRLSDIGVISQKKLFTNGSILIGNYYVLNLKKGANIQDVYQKLTQIPEIQNAAPDYILKIQETPNDTYFEKMWNLKMINAEDAWSKVHVNGKVTVGVVDTGVDYNHEDLRGVVLKGKNFIANNNNPMDDQGHGTHVAGIIGAVTNNNLGISGVSWGAKILAVKACDQNGDCKTSNVARAIQYAVDSGVKIINVSIAGAGSCNGTYNDTLAYAVKKGALVIVAAGNGDNGDGVGVDASTQIPAGCNGALAVGALTNQATRAPYSNYGNKVEVSAPGGYGPCSIPTCILSLSPNNGYMLRSGTSMAAPQVAGVAALIYAHNLSLSMQQVKSCLIDGGNTLSLDEPMGQELNAAQSIELCSKSNKPTPTTPPIQTSAISGTVYIDKNGNGRMDKNEKPFSGAQVVLSGLTYDSVLSNSYGKYIFPNLLPGLYTISLTVNGKSVGEAVDITLVGQGETVVYDFAVPPDLAVIPVPTSSEQQPASQCHLDPSCLDPKNAFQICSFQCPQ